MTKILRDNDIEKLFDTVIVRGDTNNLRPNSYILRVGNSGEFFNTNKEFKIGEKRKKGIKIPSGHSVGLTAFEEIDFRAETVHKIFPERNLHGLLSPTTDLAREGMIAPTTQIDAGYNGTLNWTINNTSPDERTFLFKENIYRLTLFLLEADEVPENLYAGTYQGQTGYIRSKRPGAPAGMQKSDWATAFEKDDPEKHLENLIKSGYPWNLLGERLKRIDEQFGVVTNEYSQVQDSIDELSAQVKKISEHQAGIKDTIRAVIKEESSSMQNSFLIKAGMAFLGIAGLAMTVSQTPQIQKVIQGYGSFIGLILIVITVLFFLVKRK